MTQFIKLSANCGYHLTDGMEGCIVPVEEIIGDLAVVPAPALGAFCKPEHKHLAGPLTCVGSPNRYYFNERNYEVVDNPFSHWNALKSGELR